MSDEAETQEPKKKAGFTDPYGAEDGSMGRSKDPEIRRKIRDGRREAQMDLRAMEAWARGGFESGLSGERT